MVNSRGMRRFFSESIDTFFVQTHKIPNISPLKRWHTLKTDENEEKGKCDMHKSSWKAIKTKEM